MMFSPNSCTGSPVFLEIQHNPEHVDVTSESKVNMYACLNV